jgi:hypothetical protein
MFVVPSGVRVVSSPTTRPSVRGVARTTVGRRTGAHVATPSSRSGRGLETVSRGFGGRGSEASSAKSIVDADE